LQTTTKRKEFTFLFDRKVNFSFNYYFLLFQVLPLLYLKNKLPFPVFFEASLIEWKIVSSPVVMSTSFAFPFLCFFCSVILLAPTNLFV